MAGSPPFKVYNKHGEYKAACKELEAAAAVVALYGEGATIRYEHGPVLWTEGTDGLAGDSYDEVAGSATKRLRKLYDTRKASTND